MRNVTRRNATFSNALIALAFLLLGGMATTAKAEFSFPPSSCSTCGGGAPRPIPVPVPVPVTRTVTVNRTQTVVVNRQVPIFIPVGGQHAGPAYGGYGGYYGGYRGNGCRSSFRRCSWSSCCKKRGGRRFAFNFGFMGRHGGGFGFGFAF